MVRNNSQQRTRGDIDYWMNSRVRRQGIISMSWYIWQMKWWELVIVICQIRGIAHLRGDATLATLVSSFPLDFSSIEEVGVHKIGLSSFELPGGHQPQNPILSKKLLPHQERIQITFHGGRLLMPLLKFGLQWEQIVYLPAHYLLQSFLMVRLLSSMTPTTRKALCDRF